MMAVGRERSRWSAELPVEVDGSRQGDDARGDSTEEPLRCASEVVLDPKLLLERVDDRLDALADAPDRRRAALGLVCPARSQNAAGRGGVPLERLLA